MNGTAGGKGALDQDEEMPEQHELGEELAFTGRYGKNCPELWLNLIRLKHTERDFGNKFGETGGNYLGSNSPPQKAADALWRAENTKVNLDKLTHKATL